tara:strand:+ start:435 stop:650 length:216 start_codon:yes stop_codon:yes gene_type:complete
MSDNIINKVNKDEWYKAIHVSELVYTIIDSSLSQSPISKLDKDISKHIEEGANSIYKASLLIKKKLKNRNE